jgi:hypothetical protein
MTHEDRTATDRPARKSHRRSRGESVDQMQRHDLAGAARRRVRPAGVQAAWLQPVALLVRGGPGLAGDQLPASGNLS